MESSASPTVLLIGGTGTVGSHVARALVGRCALRGLARTDAAARRLAEIGVEPVRGDLARPATLPAAMEGVEHVYLATPREDQFDHEWNAIEAAERAGVRRLVKVSILYARETDAVYIRRPHHVVERRLAESPMATTSLEPATFMTHFAAQIDRIARGRISFPAPQARIAFVDPRDVAEVAAAVLCGDAALDGAHPITGPDALTFAQAAERIGARLGRSVIAEDCSPESYRSIVLETGAPEWLADGLVEIYEDFERRGATPVADTVARVLRRPPRSLDEFTDDVLADLLGSHAG